MINYNADPLFWQRFLKSAGFYQGALDVSTGTLVSRAMRPQTSSKRSRWTSALSGFGGIGKTQTAIEYAHRYRNDYNAVFFIRTDTETALTAGLVEIAGVLALAGRDARDQKETVGAVRLAVGKPLCAPE